MVVTRWTIYLLVAHLAFDSVAKSSSCLLSWILATIAREELDLLQELFFAIADPDSERMTRNQLVHAASNYVGEQVHRNYLSQIISDVQCDRCLTQRRIYFLTTIIRSRVPL